MKKKTLIILKLFMYCVLAIGFHSSLIARTITTSTSYLVDETGALSPEKILSEPQNFLTYKSEKLSLGFMNDQVFIRMLIKNLDEKAVEIFVEQEYPLIDELSLFYSEDGDMKIIETGDSKPFDSRMHPHRNFIFDFEIPANSERVLYFRFKSSSSMRVELIVKSSAEYVEESSYKTLFYGLYYGVLAIMMVYSLAIGVVMQDRSYSFYFLFLTTFGLFQASVNGFAFQFLWPNNSWLADNMVSIMQLSAMGCLILFTRAYLDTKIKTPKIDRYLVWFGLMLLVFLVGGLALSYKIRILVGSLLSIVQAVFLLSLGIHLAIRGYRPAVFYAGGWIFFLAGTIGLTLHTLGIVDLGSFASYAQQVGSIFEIAIFSVGLSAKFATLRKEKFLAQRKALNEERAAKESQRKILIMQQDANEKLEKRVDERTREIKSILNNVSLGVFTISGDYQLGAEHSKFLHEIIETPVTWDNIRAVFDDSKLTTDELDKLFTCLECSIGEDQLNFLCNNHCLPSKLSIQVKDRFKELEIEWDSIVNGEDIVEKILVTIRDVTELREFEKKSQEKEKELAKIVELLDLDPGNVQEFFNMANFRLQECHKILKADASHQEKVKKLFVHLHTLKGESRTLHFRDLSSEIHEAESFITEFGNANSNWDRESVELRIRGVQNKLNIYQHVNHVLLGRNPDDDDIKIPRLDFKEMEQQLHNQDYTGLQKKLHGFSKLGLNLSIRNLLEDLVKPANELARDLNKSVPSLEITSIEYDLTPFQKGLLQGALTHLLRNSLDHGIEETSIRKEKGKDPSGKISIAANVTSEFVQITFEDDGSGLNLDRIVGKALSRNLIESPAELSDQEKAELIFHPGFSTTENLSEISGRGVGMDAVKSEVESVGGTVSLILRTQVDGAYAFAIVISIPKQELLRSA